MRSQTNKTFIRLNNEVKRNSFLRERMQSDAFGVKIYICKSTFETMYSQITFQWSFGIPEKCGRLEECGLFGNYGANWVSNMILSFLSKEVDIGQTLTSRPIETLYIAGR